MNTELTFDRFLEVFVPGAILTIGTWYLHRPFLLVFFPAVASDVAILDVTGSALGAKALVFFITAICVGVLVNYMWDIAVVCVVNDAAGTNKARRWIRRLLRWLSLPFVICRDQDPRVHAMSRYLESPRRDQFLKMLKSWAGTDGHDLANPAEIILAHQHIVSRLKVTSHEMKATLEEIHRPVLISSSVFISSALLVPSGFLSFLTANSVRSQVAVQPWYILLALTFGAYAFAVISCYSLKRHFRHFCSEVLTLALHRYLIDEKNDN